MLAPVSFDFDPANINKQPCPVPIPNLQIQVNQMAQELTLP